jgi:hypothetical protein
VANLEQATLWNFDGRKGSNIITCERPQHKPTPRAKYDVRSARNPHGFEYMPVAAPLRAPCFVLARYDRAVISVKQRGRVTTDVCIGLYKSNFSYIILPWSMLFGQFNINHGAWGYLSIFTHIFTPFIACKGSYDN